MVVGLDWVCDAMEGFGIVFGDPLVYWDLGWILGHADAAACADEAWLIYCEFEVLGVYAQIELNFLLRLAACQIYM